MQQLTNDKIWLAPLAGYTDFSFRTICKECGADVIVSEMVSADGLIYNEEKTLRYARFSEFQRPFGVQLFGSKPDILAKATEKILEIQPDFIDLNMGCPVKKVVKRGAGSALMRDKLLSEKIVKEVKAVLRSCGIPLSAKIRSGWNSQSINAVDFSKMLEQSGIDLLTVHPRTRSQMFSDKSDWQLIKSIKKNLRIPVIGNGDIFSDRDAFQIKKETKCDSIMIGRRVIGKPWLILETKDFLKTGKSRNISSRDKLRLIRRHVEIFSRTQENSFFEIRKHIIAYTKGLQNSSKIRVQVERCNDPDEMLRLMEELYQ